MIFILTGEVQTGKSRWLQRVAQALPQMGIPIYGVLAPGIWVPSDGPHADANGFEKTGIQNILLPQNETIPFATRVDLAKNAQSYDAESQSGRAQLTWHIPDAAIERVNGHLASIPSLAAQNPMQNPTPGLLIVDELGRLELLRNEGLTEALSLLEAGPSQAIPHALIVVRNSLLNDAQRIIPSSWGEIARILPDEAGYRAVLCAFNMQD